MSNPGEQLVTVPLKHVKRSYWGGRPAKVPVDVVLLYDLMSGLSVDDLAAAYGVNRKAVREHLQSVASTVAYAKNEEGVYAWWVARRLLDGLMRGECTPVKSVIQVFRERLAASGRAKADSTVAPS